MEFLEFFGAGGLDFYEASLVGGGAFDVAFVFEFDEVSGGGLLAGLEFLG